MAVAKVECTCEYCGEKFFKKKTCYNRKEADSWEEWAKKAFTECPECYGKRVKEEEAKKPLTITLELDVLTPALIFTASGNTLENKDTLKAAGYHWDYAEEGGLFGGLFSNPRRAWQKRVKLKAVLDSEEAPEEIVQAFREMDELGAVKKIGYSDADLAMVKNRLLDIKKTEAAKQEELNKLQKPERPECLPKGRWNEKIYGSANGYSIYVDGDKIVITADQKKELENWLDSWETYNKAVAEIEKKYK